MGIVLENSLVFKGMVVYIFGSTGMLGRYMKKQFPEAICLGRDASYELNEGDVVINAAGVIPHSGSTDYTFNTTFPLELGELCRSKKAHLIHFSTDCVFSGSRGMYTEQDVPDAETAYGRSKANGDAAYGTILRTSIIGEEARNKRSLLEWVRTRKGERIHGFTNHIWNGVTCWQLSKIVRQVIETQNFWIGVRHVFSPNPVSKLTLITMIADVYDIDTYIIPHLDWHGTNKNMTLSSAYPMMSNDIPELLDQIKEQKSIGAEM